MKYISSKENSTYKSLIKLKKKKHRDETGTYIIEGIKPLADALNAGCPVHEIFVREGNGIGLIPEERSFRNKGFVTGMSILLVWLIATLIYVLIEMIRPDFHNHWLAFIYAVPVSLIVWLVLNSIWFNRRINFLIISLLMWSVLATAFITPLPYGFNAWLIFVVGIPGQAIILLWSRIQRKKKA